MRDSSPDQPDTPPSLPAVPAAAPRGFPDEAQPAAFPSEEPAFNVRRFLAAVARYKWLVALLSLGGAALGFVLSQHVPSQYTAQATLWIQEDQGGGRQSGPIQSAGLLQWASWVDLLQSFVVLDDVVRQQHVYLEPGKGADAGSFQGFQLKPTFVPGEYRLDVSRDGRTFVLSVADQQVQRGTVGDSVGATVGFMWVPNARALRAGTSVRFRVRAPREAALQLRNNLKANVPQQGSFLQLELTGTDPAATAGTLNAIADRFVSVAVELKRQKLSELSAILQQQLNASYADLGRAERALEGFRVHTITLPSEQASPVTPGLEQTRDPVFNAFFKMRVDRDQLDRDRQAIERALAQSDSDVSSMELEAIPSVRGSAELSQALTLLASKEADARAMRLQFGDSYPPLQRLNAEIQNLRHQSVPELARKLAVELASQVRDMDSNIGSASRELQQIPARVIEEARLRRDVAIAENLYTTLQQRYEETRLAELSSIPDVRILDRAVTPEHPLKNKAMMLLLGGVFGGVGAAAGLALLLDRLDRRVRDPDQVTLGMGLSILGVVPRLRNGGRLAGNHGEAQVVESLRSIRLNLEYAYGAAGPLVVAITSPGSGDGKSFLASNLAVSFADAGHRTLIVDADIRRGNLHRVFNLQRKPGLLDFLGGSAPQETIVQRTSIQGIEFIGGGSRKISGPELLASAAMSQLLISLRRSYTVIILDCAPLGAGVDALVLASLTGNMVLVLRTGVTDREFAMAKLEHVSRLPIRVLGAVINDVQPGSRYGSYAYYGYLPGYESAEEGETTHEGVKRRLRGKS